MARPLVVGLSAIPSDNFMVLCQFLGRASTLKAIERWNVHSKQAMASNRHALVTHLGQLVSLA